MKTQFPLWRLLPLFFLPACGSTLSSRSGSPTDRHGTETFVVHGMPYFLPVGVITIKGEYTEPKEDPGSPKANQKDAPPVSDAVSGNSVSIAFANWTITITGDVEADPGTPPYYAVPRRNYLFDDEYQVTVNSKHLLSVGNTTANDKTAEILGTVASLAASALYKAAPTTPPEDQSPFLVSFRVNDSKEFENAQDVLRKRLFALEPLRPPPFRRDLTKEEMEAGLVFRLAEPYELTLLYPVGASARSPALRRSHVFILPGKQSYVLDYGRVAFVKKVQNYGFSDGMLTDYHETLPSPILGVLGIPKAIAGAIVPLIGGGSLGGAAAPPASTGPPAAPPP